MNKILHWTIKFFFGLVQFLIVLAAVGILVYLYLLRPFQVKGFSMYPTFSDKQYLLVNQVAYESKSPEYGDIVVFTAPDDPSRDYIKRVVALPGDSVMIADSVLFVNDVAVDESSYLRDNTLTLEGKFLKEGVEIVVPADSFFLAGDNRPGSNDSRDYGPVPNDNFIGKVWISLWPREDFGVVTHLREE
jgi:signal peptidase I